MSVSLRPYRRCAAALLVAALFAAGWAYAGAIAPATVSPPQLEPDAPAAGRFLVASRDMNDPRFRESVILLLNHDEQGTLGLIVNRPTRLMLSELLGDPAPGRLYFGGPVRPSVLSLLLRHDGPGEEGETMILEDLHLVFGADAVIERIGRLADDEGARVYAGYAGWGPGQLDAELRGGGWRLTGADAGSVFSAEPDRLWETLMRRFEGHWI